MSTYGGAFPLSFDSPSTPNSVISHLAVIPYLSRPARVSVLFAANVSRVYGSIAAMLTRCYPDSSHSRVEPFRPMLEVFGFSFCYDLQYFLGKLSHPLWKKTTRLRYRRWGQNRVWRIPYISPAGQATLSQGVTQDQGEVEEYFASTPILWKFDYSR